MSRYIDAEPLERNLTELFVEIVKAQPTADVEPVRHGHWINDIDYAGWTCSECGDHEGNKMDKYCHSCGARMDGERKR